VSPGPGLAREPEPRPEGAGGRPRGRPLEQRSDTLARVTQPQPSQPSSSPFVRACRGEPVPYTPVWFMRQAGRSLPEYHRVREGIAMLESCTRPELITEITLQPLRRYDVDAAVLFSDIVVPLRAVGVDVSIKPGVGPVVGSPVRTLRDVERLRPLEPGDVPYISDAVKSLVGELDGKPLIGFAGAPFTLASYLVEGGPSRNHDRTRAMMYGNPELWHALMSRLAAIATVFLQVQAEAGASAVQLFDSWVGVVSPEDYRHAILPHTRRIFSALAPFGIPRIHFGVGTGELLGLLGEAGADVVGVDWRISLDEAARRVGAGAAEPGAGEPGAGRQGKALQGNLDPALLLAGWDVVEPRARAIVDRGRMLGGHIFNLGHGVLPETDPGILARLADFVHEASAATA
jgi:uroporphyrinogen decarboxylase